MEKLQLSNVPILKVFVGKLEYSTRQVNKKSYKLLKNIKMFPP